MKKQLLSLFAVVFASAAIQAQCTNLYIDEAFASFDSVSVVYSSTNQVMTIYTPTGDVSTKRPLLIMAHGGSFVGGNRYEVTSSTICQNFAKRGYVTASISYRLASSPFDMINTNTAYPVVVKAISDAKAAVRYFSKDAATTNTYKVDTNNMFFGGNSAGAIIAIQYAYIDDTTELAADLRSVMNANGGIEGNSGNSGYSSKIKAILNLAGGILDTAWIANATEQPAANFHGDADGTVPFNCGRVLNGASQIALCGTGTMTPRFANLGINHVTKVYPGDGHVPWEGSAAKFNEVDSMSAEFLSRRICGNVGIQTIDKSSLLNVSPNPASDRLTVEFNGTSSIIEIVFTDAVGRQIISNTPTSNVVNISTQNIPNGLYFVEVRMKDNFRAVQRVQIMK